MHDMAELSATIAWGADDGLMGGFVLWLPRGVAAQLMVEDGRSCDWEFCSGGLGEMRMRTRDENGDEVGEDG